MFGLWGTPRHSILGCNRSPGRSVSRLTGRPGQTVAVYPIAQTFVKIASNPVLAQAKMGFEVMLANVWAMGYARTSLRPDGRSAGGGAPQEEKAVPNLAGALPQPWCVWPPNLSNVSHFGFGPRIFSR